MTQTSEVVLDRKEADALAQEVVNLWGTIVSAGDDPAVNLNAVFEIADRYRRTRQTADNYRNCNLTNPEIESEEKSALSEFIQAYREFEALRHAKPE